MTTTTFYMPRQLEAVDAMVLTLKGRLEGILTDDALFRFDLCLSETLANLVLHAKTAVSAAQIDVRLNIENGTVVAEIFDPEGAQAFDIRNSAQNLSEIDVMAESGRGLGLILACADAVDYGAVNHRNRLSLTFVERV